MSNISSIKVRKTNTVYGIQDAAASLAIEQMKNGTDIDSFGDVETALNNKSDFFTLSGKLEWDEDLVTHEKILHGSYTPTVTADNENPVTSKGVYNFAFPRDEQAVLGAKNLLKNTASSSGIFTINSDGTVSATGSSGSSDASEIKVAENITFPFDVILSGCPSGGSTTTYRIRANSSGGTLYSDVGEGILIPANTQIASVRCRVEKNQTVSDLVFKPMIRIATDTDSTFVPYAMTNRELTEKVKGIINAATNAADFAAFKTAIGNL